jgi:predicted dehydrogenase
MNHRQRNTVRVGIISWAHIHAEFRAKALAEIPAARIVAIADDEEGRGTDAARRYGAAFHRDWRELVARPDVDVVMIESENNRHAEQALAAARSGKDIFCEKPMATNDADADAMVAAAAKAGVDLTIAFVSRFGKEAERAKQLVDSGVLGRIVNARAFVGLAGIEEIGCPAAMARWMEDPVSGGGGAWIDEGSHAVDMMRWMVGEIDSVMAVTSKQVKTHLEVEDSAAALLRFNGGALGEVGTSWSLAIDIGMRNTLELYGARGSLFLEMTSRTPKVEVYGPEAAGGGPGWLRPHIVPAVTEPHDYSSWPPHVHHYKREVSSYVQKYLGGRMPYGPTGEDGRAVVNVVSAGYESARTGSAVTLR